MARRYAAMGVSVFGMMMMAMIIGAAAQAAPPPAVDCQTVVLTLSDCLSYVTGGDKTPPAACCTELGAVIKDNPQCLCLLFNTSFTEPLGVNVTRAQQLPPACKLQTPPTSLCASVGIPVPGPVSSTSPVVAPSPAKTPTSSPATSPMAPSPMSSSPSPSTTPSASSPSPMSPTPTSSTSPAGSPTSSTSPVGSQPSTPSALAPSPSSAPTITSWNVGVVTSLLLLTSMFFS